ncbi:MAG: cupredoxin domain-containing protein, partial [Actinobacteria bacterium]
AGALSHRVKRVMNTVAAVVIIAFGLVMLNRGLMLVGSPVTAQSVVASVMGRSAAPAAQPQFTEAADGVAEVPLVIENTRFVPQTVSVPSDRPVRLIVDRREANACSDQIAIPQLGVLQNLAPNGVTTVDLPAAKSGSYTLTCGMGMMSGTLAVGTDAPAQSGGTVGTLLLLAALAAGAAGLAALASRKRRGTSAVHTPERGAAAPAHATASSGTAVHAMTPRKRVDYLVFVLAAGVLLLGGTAYAVSRTRAADADVSSAARYADAADAGVSAASAGGSSCACCPSGAAGASATGTATVEAGVQGISVDVTQGYYDPDTIVLAAGAPAEITFSESSGCTSQVMSKDLGFFEDLTTGPKTVKLPALPPGEYGFSCGMQMVFGTIVVK